jgi:hypothetical protein
MPLMDFEAEDFTDGSSITESKLKPPRAPPRGKRHPARRLHVSDRIFLPLCDRALFSYREVLAQLLGHGQCAARCAICSLFGELFNVLGSELDERGADCASPAQNYIVLQSEALHHPGQIGKWSNPPV